MATLVIGASEATGGAIARRFAREGYIACVTRRSQEKLQRVVNEIRNSGGEAHGFGSDPRKEDEMIALIEKIERDIALIEVAVFNIGANVRVSITETTSRAYQKVWEMACFACPACAITKHARVLWPKGIHVAKTNYSTVV
jgi:NAD(P)-dependent dehydrogenase (short-subunit alcohol dehydrogenase family)